MTALIESIFILTVGCNTNIITFMITLFTSIGVTMSALTIRLPDKTLSEVDKRAQEMKISRAEYIRQCIEAMNQKMYEKEKKNKLIRASQLTRKESMLINSEFSEVENDPEA
jgi:metal-responsive CopG/Arc/MetJ family transcriptional regulator